MPGATFPRRVSRRIAAARVRLGLTQEGLAARLGDFGNGTLPTDSKVWESFAAGDM